MSVPAVAVEAIDAVNVSVVPSAETEMLLMVIFRSREPAACFRKATDVVPPRLCPVTETFVLEPRTSVPGDIVVITGPVVADTGGLEADSRSPTSTSKLELKIPAGGPISTLRGKATGAKFATTPTATDTPVACTSPEFSGLRIRAVACPETALSSSLTAEIPTVRPVSIVGD